jgi:hypothetical protein
MAALLLGLRRSLPHLPLGRAANDWRIGHPGYPE